MINMGMLIRKADSKALEFKDYQELWNYKSH
jgi:hypothetical protein